ncbi:chalcone-flavanone isomerase-domain-containing protein [Aspergillus filifer]
MKPLTMQNTLPFRNGAQCLRRRFLRPAATTRYLYTSSPLRTTATNTIKPPRTRTKAKAAEDEAAKYKRSMKLSAAGMAVCAVGMFGVIKLDLFGLEQQEKKPSATRLDGPQGFPESPSVIRVQGKDGAEEIPTGTSSVPHFPSVIRLPKYQGTADVPPAKLSPNDEITSAAGGGEEEEYQLLGLGIRTVSFLRIQVYVVGLYVAKSDISNLQQRLVQMAVHPPSEEQVISNPVGATSATSLVSTERQRLKELLLDEEKGDDAWNAILKDDGLKTVFRIVPTRNTDFLHLRDGWVRGITARAQKFNAAAKAQAAAAASGETSSPVTPSEFTDESFGTAMNDFKSLFGGGQRKSVPKGQTLLLLRNERGELDALLQPKDNEPYRFMGRVTDERIGRLVWLNYLAGKNVSSDEARKSVVDGIMGIVERPIGTVVQKIL